MLLLKIVLTAQVAITNGRSCQTLCAICLFLQYLSLSSVLNLDDHGRMPLKTFCFQEVATINSESSSANFLKISLVVRPSLNVPLNFNVFCGAGPSELFLTENLRK